MPEVTKTFGPSPETAVRSKKIRLKHIGGTILSKISLNSVVLFSAGCWGLTDVQTFRLSVRCAWVNRCVWGLFSTYPLIRYMSRMAVSTHVYRQLHQDL